MMTIVQCQPSWLRYFIWIDLLCALCVSVTSALTFDRLLLNAEVTETRRTQRCSQNEFSCARRSRDEVALKNENSQSQKLCQKNKILRTCYTEEAQRRNWSHSKWVSV